MGVAIWPEHLRKPHTLRIEALRTLRSVVLPGSLSYGNVPRHLCIHRMTRYSYVAATAALQHQFRQRWVEFTINRNSSKNEPVFWLVFVWYPDNVVRPDAAFSNQGKLYNVNVSYGISCRVEGTERDNVYGTWASAGFLRDGMKSRRN